MKLAIIFNQDKLSGKLTRLFTGCYAYHTAWVDEEAGKLYDMHWIRRRRLWPHYDEGEYLLYDFQMVTREYLEQQLDTDENWYGMKDYVLFALRWLFHLFGLSTRNAGGVICSEMINIDVWSCGGETPWSVEDAPPSPCDWQRWMKRLEDMDDGSVEAPAARPGLYLIGGTDRAGSHRAADDVSLAAVEEAAGGPVQPD